jgi:beta-mannosidase
LICPQVWGLLLWQATEIWPTGGWGSLEYSSMRWKPLHHILAQHLYTPVMVAITGPAGSAPRSITGLAVTGSTGFVRNDLPKTMAGVVRVDAVHLNGSSTTSVLSHTFDSLPPSTLQWFDATAATQACPPTSCVLVSSVIDTATKATVATNVQLQAPPHQLELRKDTVVTFKVALVASPDGTVAIAVTTSSATAVAVVLTTSAAGYFSENVFTATPGDRTVRFVPFAVEDMDEVLAQLKSTTRVEHMAQHIV